MQYENYLARKRARFEGICGHVNIPYGTALTVQDGFIMWKGQQVCGITSQTPMITSPKTMMAGERNGANWFLPFFCCWNGGITGIRAGGIRFGRMPVANSTSARITMIIGFGTLSSIMPRWRI